MIYITYSLEPITEVLPKVVSTHFTPLNKRVERVRLVGCGKTFCRVNTLKDPAIPLLLYEQKEVLQFVVFFWVLSSLSIVGKEQIPQEESRLVDAQRCV